MQLTDGMETDIAMGTRNKFTPYLMPTDINCLHWKSRVVMMPTLFSMVVPEVVLKKTFGATIDNKVGRATRDDKVGIPTTLIFQCMYN